MEILSLVGVGFLLGGVAMVMRKLGKIETLINGNTADIARQREGLQELRRRCPLCPD